MNSDKKKQLIKKEFKQHQQDIQTGMLKHSFTEYVFHVDGITTTFNQDSPIEQFNAFVDSIGGQFNFISYSCLMREA